MRASPRRRVAIKHRKRERTTTQPTSRRAFPGAHARRRAQPPAAHHHDVVDAAASSSICFQRLTPGYHHRDVPLNRLKHYHAYQALHLRPSVRSPVRRSASASKCNGRMEIQICIFFGSKNQKPKTIIVKTRKVFDTRPGSNRSKVKKVKPADTLNPTYCIHITYEDWTWTWKGVRGVDARSTECVTPPNGRTDDDAKPRATATGDGRDAAVFRRHAGTHRVRSGCEEL